MPNIDDSRTQNQCSTSRPGSRLVQESYPEIPSAMPYAFNSWEGMTNIEKFDTLKTDFATLCIRFEDLSSTVYKLQGLLEQHRHSVTDGSVLIQYNRDR